MVVCGLQAIHGYRETERLNWTQKNKVIFDRVREHAFPSDAKHMSFIHVLDLAKEGCIKAHIDSIRVSIPLIIIAVINSWLLPSQNWHYLPMRLTKVYLNGAARQITIWLLQSHHQNTQLVS